MPANPGAYAITTHPIKKSEKQKKSLTMSSMKNLITEEEMKGGATASFTSLCITSGRDCFGEAKLSKKFDVWREVQQKTNPQYTIDDEIAYLLGEAYSGELAKAVFDELYEEQGYTLNLETKSYDTPSTDDE